MFCLLVEGEYQILVFQILLVKHKFLVNILNECLRILIDCKTYYNVLFGSFTRDRHARRRIYRRMFGEYH